MLNAEGKCGSVKGKEGTVNGVLTKPVFHFSTAITPWDVKK